METSIQIKNNIQEITQKVANFLDENVKITILDKSKDEKNKIFWVSIESEKAALLIGHEGSNLKAIQHIITAMNRKRNQPTKVIIDINNYRLNRLEFLRKIALINSERVVQTKHLVILRPMSAYERRVIHLTLASKKDVETESLGEEPNRYVIIKPKKKI